jgi:hypothetical protein
MRTKLGSEVFLVIHLFILLNCSTFAQIVEGLMVLASNVSVHLPWGIFDLERCGGIPFTIRKYFKHSVSTSRALVPDAKVFNL